MSCKQEVEQYRVSKQREMIITGLLIAVSTAFIVLSVIGLASTSKTVVHSNNDNLTLIVCFVILGFMVPLFAISTIDYWQAEACVRMNHEFQQEQAEAARANGLTP